MALVENHGAPNKGERFMETQKRVRVVVTSRAVNTSFHGLKLREGENEITIPVPWLKEIEEQVEDLDWGPVVARYEEELHRLTHDDNGDRVLEDEQVVYNISRAFVDQYRREPRRFKAVRIIEDGITPELSPQDAMTLAVIDKISANQSGGRKARGVKTADGSTE